MTKTWRWIVWWVLWSASTLPAAELGPKAPIDELPADQAAMAARAFSRGDPLPPWVEAVDIPPTTRRNPVVTRLADTQFHVGVVHAYYSNRAVQVNDSAALARIGQYQLYFVPQYQNLHLHRVELLREGKVLDRTNTADVRFLQREINLERGSYSGGVTVSILIDDVRVGDTLHISYTVEGSNPVFGNTYSGSASWDQEDPIELRVVTLTYPANREISWQMQGDFRQARPVPELSVNNGIRRLRWSETAIDGVDFEPAIPDRYLPARTLQFSEYRDWRAVARWAQQLFADGGPLSDEMRRLVDRLKTLPSEEARVLGALQWVQEEVRYFAVSFGESSHRPYPPSEVVKRRFGDCKDKTFLLLVLLRELGINAHPLLVSLQYPKLPSKFLPTPFAFDHVMVEATVDGKSRVLDGTRLGQRGKLSRRTAIPTEMQGLAISPDTTSLTSVAAPNPRELNTVSLSEHFSLPRFDGDGRLESQFTWNGSDAERLRVAASQLTRDQLRNFALRNYERLYPGIDLVAEPVWSDDGTNNRMTLRASFTVPKLASEVSGGWSMKFYPGNLRGLFNVPPHLKRSFPLTVLPPFYVAKYELTADWPENVAALNDPRARRINNAFFDAEVAQSFRGNRAKVEFSMTALTEEVHADQLPKLMEDIKQLEQLVGGYLFVDKAAIKSDGLFGIGRSTLQDSMSKRLREAMLRIDKAIAGGQLSGDDLAEAYCSRGETLVDLGTPAEGLKDVERAVLLAPQFGRSWQCRGAVEFALGNFSRAALDFSKGIALGADPFASFYRRGHSRFYQGKLAEAADDFAKAAAAGGDGGGRLYAELWQVWSLQRLGRAVPEGIANRARADAHGEWPRPALAMLIGALSPEEMLAEVNKKQGDERELTMTEALFYLGQHLLNQGRNAQATEAFQQVRAKGITVYIEHVAAGFELNGSAKMPSAGI